MNIVPPKSGFAAMSDLALALSQLAVQPEPLILPSVHRRLIEAEASLRTALNALEEARTARSQAARAWRSQGALMVRLVRDFYQNLMRTAKRDPAAQIWLETFHLKQKLPTASTLTTLWYEQARQIADANLAVSAQLASDPGAYAVALPSSPSAAEVAAILPDALATRHAYQQACSDFKRAELAAREARVQGQHQLAGLRKLLAGLFHGLSAERRRAEMAKFGVRYASAAPQTAPEETAVTVLEVALPQGDPTTDETAALPQPTTVARHTTLPSAALGYPKDRAKAESTDPARGGRQKPSKRPRSGATKSGRTMVHHGKHHRRIRLALRPPETSPGFLTTESSEDHSPAPPGGTTVEASMG